MAYDACRALRSALAERSAWPLPVPGVYDVLGARVAEAAGFPAVGVSGYALSAALLGRPDAGYLSLPELAMVVRNIAQRCRLPVIADSDTGFGNALSAMRAAEELIGTGAAALFMEDQVAPKRCGHVAGKQVVPAEEFAGKLRAIDRVRRELKPEFVLIARTDARGVAGGSLDEAIRRGRLYREVGVDVVFPEGLASPEAIQRCGEAIGGPLLYNMAGLSPRVPLADLGAWGVGLVVWPVVTFQAALRAMWDVLHQLKAEGLPALLAFEASLTSHPTGDTHKFVGFPEIRQLEDEYLPSAELIARYEGSLGYRANAHEGE